MRALALVAVVLCGAGTPAFAGPMHAASEAVARYQTRRAEAVAPLRAAIAAHPLIADALRTLLAEAHLAAGDAAAARATAQTVMHNDPRWAHRAAYVAARAAMPGDCKGAIELLEKARIDPPWVREAPRLALLSAAHAACGDAETAAAIDRTLATAHPDAPEGEAAFGRVELDPADMLKRAAGFEKARDYGSAAKLLEALAAGEAGDAARFRLAVLHLDRIREDFRKAEALFERVAAGEGDDVEEATYLIARTRGRRGDVVGALRGYADYLRRNPKGRFVEDARFFSAFLQYEHGRYAEAAAAFEPLRATGKWASAAEWYHAWSRYLAGERAPTVPLFDAVARRQPGSRAARQAAYWAARALEEQAPAEAAERRKTLVDAQPHDWYGLLIRRRFPGEHAPLPALPSAAPQKPVVPPAFMARAVEIQALAAAGLPDFARRALAGISDELRRADAWDAEAALAAEVGDPERVYRSTAIRHRDVLRRVPAAEDAGIWRRAHPKAWVTLVDRAVQGIDVEPALVWSFIRKESAFDPDAVSPAHAVGLMQLLPRTARAILDARGQSGRSLPDLFEPAVNIDLGAWYIDALGQRFGGQLPLIAAAYNAGPRSLIGWFGGQRTVPVDRFVDTIPFRETREYVKLLVATRVLYGLVHGGQALDAAAALLPVELDLTVRPGVDF